MIKIVLASNNQKKVKEIKSILDDKKYNVVSLKDEGVDIEVDEDGLTFEDNAEKKAKEIREFLLQRGDKDFIVLSDDSGLEVDFLDGEPGVFSARYAGEHGNDEANNKKLLENMKEAQDEDRKGRFVCAMALITTDNITKVFRGTVEGYIKEELSGNGGFGYDPLFYYPQLNKTFGEASAEEKNKISHRGNALNKLKEILKSLEN